MQRRSSPGLACLAFLLAAAVHEGRAQDAGATSAGDRDPVEGKWLGTTGFPQDRVTIGFEFQRVEGGIRAIWYAPVTNFYALPLDGFLEKDGATYRHAAVRMTLELRGDSLVGTYYPLDAPITLRRTTTLPTETALPELPRGPGPLWRTKLGGSVYAPAAIHAGVAYVGTTAGMFFAVDTDSGTPLWSFAAGRPIHGEALVTDDAVFFVCDNGFLYRLDRATGQESWRYDLGDAQTVRVLGHALEQAFDFDVTAPAPVLSDGSLFVGSGDGSFHAVEADDGTRVWRFETRGKIRTTALLSGSAVVFGSFDGTLYALDRRSGTEVWRKPVGGEVTSAPALVEGLLIVGTRTGLLAALDPDTRRATWRALLWGSSVESHPVGYGGILYVGSSNLRRVTAYDPSDGRVQWRTDVYGFAWSRPLVTERLVVASVSGIAPHPIRHLGSLTVLERLTGRIVWRWPGPECDGCLMDGFVAGAALSGDRVIVGGLDGSLYAFPVEGR
jgi:outer membrane protein assembly factor BamB